MREHKAEATKMQDEILDNFLRDHPEYAMSEGEQSRSFWHNYMASQEVVKTQLEPLLFEYEKNLGLRHQWVDKLQWVSPAILTQQALVSRAGTSKIDYENFWKQASQFGEIWKGYFIPMLYTNQTFTSSHFQELPEFKYDFKSHRIFDVRVFGVLLLTVLIMLLTALKYKLSKKKNEIIL